MLLTWGSNEQILDHCLEEDFLVGQMEQLESSGKHKGSVELYWLYMSRVMELALLCAGNYADFGHILEAGALLVNPRHTEIHINGQWEPVKVKRYESMSEQFADYAPEGTEVHEWLRDNTHLVHVKGPLIPELFGMMKESGVLSESYLSSVEQRMQKITETMTFVTQGQMMDKNYPLTGVHPGDKVFVELNLCRYDREIFQEIGTDIAEMLVDVNYSSRFIR